MSDATSSLTPSNWSFGPTVKLALALVLSLGVAAFVLQTSFAYYLAREKPGLTLRFAPENAAAKIEKAERIITRALERTGTAAAAVGDGQAAGGLLGVGRNLTAAMGAEVSPPAQAPPASTLANQPGPLTDSEIADVARLAEAALVDEPLNARAVTLLGQVAALRGDDAEATRLMKIAASRSLREAPARYWLLDHFIRTAQFEDAAKTSDVLLRTDGNAPGRILPVLARLAEVEGAKPHIVTALANSPPWRAKFIATATKAARDPRTPLDLLLALRGTEAPPSATEVRDYIVALDKLERYDLAYYTWLEFLPADALALTGAVFNGGFERPLDDVPFDWSLQTGQSAIAEIVERDDARNNKALRIQFAGGRIKLGRIAQRLMLAPGKYRIAVSARGDLTGRRGMVWRLTCKPNDRTPLGETPMFVSSARAWRETGASFEVRADCPTQILRLHHDSRSTSEQFLSGTVWFDDVRIVAE